LAQNSGAGLTSLRPVVLIFKGFGLNAGTKISILYLRQQKNISLTSLY